jgi:hypothetical protein
MAGFAVSFMNQAPGPAALRIKARPGAPTGEAGKAEPAHQRAELGSAGRQGPTERARLSERAHQDRDIVYFLQSPRDERIPPVPRLHRIA